MRLRLLSAVVVLISALVGAGCSTVSQWMVITGPALPNPLVVPSADFETIWKASVAALEVLDGGGEIGAVEVGPEAGSEVEFGVGAFPKQEVAQTALAAGADE